MAYDGTVTLIAGITQANNGDFALVDASAVRVTDNKRLPDELDLKAPKANPVFTGSISLNRKQGSTVGTNSTALGDITVASGDYSFAEGMGSLATGTMSHAEGTNSEASGITSHAEGLGTKAAGAGSHSEGESTYAAAINSHTEGQNTIAFGISSHAEGVGILATESGQHASGKYNIPSNMNSAPAWSAYKKYLIGEPCENNNVYYVCKQGHTSTSTFDATKWIECGTNESYAEIIGNGESNAARSNARALDWNGNEYLHGNAYVQCNDNSTNGKKLATEEYVTTSIASKTEIDDTAGSGVTNKAWSANKLTTELNLKAPKESPVFTGSISLGRKANTTVGNKSVAEGNNITATGAYSHAEGDNTTTSATCAHAEGQNTTASGLNSHAEGYTTTASGQHSHAEGSNTTASGMVSHAEGGGTVASGFVSHAEGNATIANSKGQHVFGAYNIEDSNSTPTNYGTYIEIVGNGSSDARSNARTLDWNGNEYLKGDLYTGCNADSSGGSKVININYLFSGYIDYVPDDNLMPGFYTDTFYHEVGTDYVGILKKWQGITVKTSWVPSGNPPYHIPSTSDEYWDIYSYHKIFDDLLRLAESLDSNFEPTKVYQAGDVVRHNNYLYARNSWGFNTPVAEEWNIQHWTRTDLHALLNKKAPINNPEFTGSISLSRKADTSVGNGSAALGLNTSAEGAASVALGNNTIASTNSQLVFGEFNQDLKYSLWVQSTHYNVGDKVCYEEEYYDDQGIHISIMPYVCTVENTDVFFDNNHWSPLPKTSNYVEIVGNGTAANARSNARALDFNGNEYLNGDIYVNCDANSENGKKLATEEYVQKQADAMIYKGVVNANSDLPATHEKGWVYKVATAGTYVGKTCEVGDMIICNTDGTAASDAHWDVIQTNINGAVTGPASSTNNRIAIFDGATGKVIKESSYVAGAAAEKGVDTSIATGSTSTNLPTTQAVATQLDLKAPIANPEFTGSISLGRKANTTVGRRSSAIGDGVTSSGQASLAEGKASQATGNYSHAEGNSTLAQGQESHAEGAGTRAYGANSHAEGNSTTTGDASNSSLGESAHAEGAYTRATGTASHAEGGGGYAIGNFSHTGGGIQNYEAYATGEGSFAHGAVAIATKRSQFVFGEANVYEGNSVPQSSVSEKGAYIEIVGNGTFGTGQTTVRSNARTLDWNGNERLNGDLYVGCNADSTGGSKVATEQYVQTKTSVTVECSYQNSTSGIIVPSGEWTVNPDPQEGKYMWVKITYTWGSGTTSVSYSVSYIGSNGSGSVNSVNGLGGNVIIDGQNIYVNNNAQDKETIYSAITRLETAISNSEIDALFV